MYLLNITRLKSIEMNDFSDTTCFTLDSIICEDLQWVITASQSGCCWDSKNSTVVINKYKVGLPLNFKKGHFLRSGSDGMSWVINGSFVFWCWYCWHTSCFYYHLDLYINSRPKQWISATTFAFLCSKVGTLLSWNISGRRTFGTITLLPFIIRPSFRLGGSNIL